MKIYAQLFVFLSIVSYSHAAQQTNHKRSRVQAFGQDIELQSPTHSEETASLTDVRLEEPFDPSQFLATVNQIEKFDEQGILQDLGLLYSPQRSEMRTPALDESVDQMRDISATTATSSIEAVQLQAKVNEEKNIVQNQEQNSLLQTIVQLLCNNYTFSKASNPDVDTVWQQAIENEDIRSIRKIFENNFARFLIDVNYQSSTTGRTALIIAAQENDFDLVYMLTMFEGARLNLRDYEYKNAYAWALALGNAKIAQLLIELETCYKRMIE